MHGVLLKCTKATTILGADDEEMRNKHVILLRSTPATGVGRPNPPILEPKAP